tara:strand:+ start:398 stop:817 length:420 start_codon:yes stop_codon:yes gene_type:complete
MKAQFLKVRVIASLLMISVLFACAAIDSMTRESSHATAQQEQPVVVIYSTEWCHWCKKAKAFMNEKKIKFIEKDPRIEKDFNELLAVARKTGVSTEKLNAVPIFIIKNRIIIGFNPEEILCMVTSKECKAEFVRSKQSF